MLSLGSTESDHVISEPCYNEVLYNRHIVKYLFGSHNMAVLYLKPHYEARYNDVELYLDIALR